MESDEPASLSSLGTIAIASVLGVIAWLIKTFTARHLEAMDSLAARLDRACGDIAEIKGDMKLLGKRIDVAEADIAEHRARREGK